MNPLEAEARVVHEMEHAKKRCISLIDLITQSLPPSKISLPCKHTLLRLVNSELRFLSRLNPLLSPPISVNIGYLESIVRIIQHASVSQVSRVCKPVPPSSSPSSPSEPVHVDVVCTLGRTPAWFLVSDRNPNYISWLGSRGGSNKGLRSRVERVLGVARSAGSLKPATLVLFFSSGVGDDVCGKLVDEFGAAEIVLFEENDGFEELEDGWVGIKSCGRARAFEIRIVLDCGDTAQCLGGLEEKQGELGSGDAFSSITSTLRPSAGDTGDVVNFDTTALIALVSGISNGGTGRLLKAPEVEMRERFKLNYEFVMAQVLSELQNPILVELRDVIAGKKGIICESVCSEFKEIVSMCGGPNEKLRADRLVKHLLVVPDGPSARVIDLPTTRKIALKNKIIFGTGDYWHAPTLTANMGFVRAISQTGMSLLTVEHRPRALTGD